jgi:Right handed beta helix region
MDRRGFLQASALTVANMWLPGSQPAAGSQIQHPAASIYVALHGNDLNPGTEQRPFASLVRAQREARALKQRLNNPITVWVRGGTYYLEAPLVFTPEDSGTAEAPVSYMAYPQEIVTISGGRKLNCRWKHFKNGIMQCSVSDVKQKSLNFTQLFVDGKRQIRARYPNLDPKNPLVSGAGYIDVRQASESWPATEFHFDPATFSKARWSRPEEAVVHLFPPDYWGNLQWEVHDVDWNESVIKLGWGGFQLNEQLFGKASTGIGQSQLYHQRYQSRFFVENVFEELDAPGEWYLDLRQGELYFMPGKDLDLAKATVEAPVLEQVVEFRGSQRGPVRYIRFSGFRIAHTTSTFLSTYEAPSMGDWTIHRGGAIFIEGAEHCSVDQCFFDAVGGNAVFVNDYNRHIRIYGNRITEAGDSAICLVGSERRIQGTNRPLPTENTISNNLIHDCGIFGKQIAGVFVSVSEKNVISHNVIYNLPRAAICVNDGWGGGHVIELNDIHDTVRETHDHGPFNSWGRGRFWCMEQSHGDASHKSGFHDGDENYVFFYPEADGNVSLIRNNLFREPPSVHQLGIDLDDGSSHYHIYNNVCIGISVKLREGDWRLVENNVFIRPGNPPAMEQGYEGNHDRFLRNIIVTSSAVNAAFGKSSVPGDSYKVNLPPLVGPIAAEIDYNLFFNNMGRFFASITPRGKSRNHLTLDQWQDMGFDKHSIFADPEFVDLERGDYRLKPTSPAFQLGFKSIDLSTVGLLPDFPKHWLASNRSTASQE